jgi:hypothetical protein
MAFRFPDSFAIRPGVEPMESNAIGIEVSLHQAMIDAMMPTFPETKQRTESLVLNVAKRSCASPGAPAEGSGWVGIQLYRIEDLASCIENRASSIENWVGGRSPLPLFSFSPLLWFGRVGDPASPFGLRRDKSGFAIRNSPGKVRLRLQAPSSGLRPEKSVTPGQVLDPASSIQHPASSDHYRASSIEDLAAASSRSP